MKITSQLSKAILVLVILSAVLSPVGTASAGLRICRTDPLIFFGDGHKLSITVSVSADVSDIKQIDYTVHAPIGSEVTRIVFTAGGLGLQEAVDVQADQPAGVYMVDTVVTTQSREVDVHVRTSLKSNASASASGHSFNHIITLVQDPAGSKSTK